MTYHLPSFNKETTTPGHRRTRLALAESITKTASSQTYYTIRFLVDRDRVADAYRAYAYFRWVDDTLDADAGTPAERAAFVQRQKSLLERCYRGETAPDAGAEEQMLVTLIKRDPKTDSGLHTYLHDMIAVMAFDANRRGQIICQAELSEYTRLLASAVTEALHYFIGHDSYSPLNEARYLAVSGAHVTHMLRDTFDDVRAGYYNIPRETLAAAHLAPQDVDSDAYRAWVRGRVQLARLYFQAGRDYLSQVENWRCRLAGFAYTARFEWLLDTFEREGCRLRPRYDERKSFATGLRMSVATLSSMLQRRSAGLPPRSAPGRQRSIREL